MKRVIAVLIFLLMGACAQQPTSQAPTVSTAPVIQSDIPQLTGQASDARTRAKAHTDLAAGYYQHGQLGVALEEVRTAISSDSTYGPAYNVLGLVYMELRDDAAAQQNFLQALRINPNDSEANNNFGWFLCQRKREEEGIRYFLAALKNPLYATPEKAYINAGVCSQQKGDITAAEDFYQKALKLNPRNPQVYYYLAELAYKQKNDEMANAYLTQYMQMINTPSVDSLWLGIRIAHRRGDRPTEASYAVRLRKNYPNAAQLKLLQAGKFE